jgi:hypothetical protein
MTLCLLGGKQAEVYLNIIQTFSSHLKENTTRLHYEDQLVNAGYGTRLERCTVGNALTFQRRFSRHIT